jgi:hypothetical protein
MGRKEESRNTGKIKHERWKGTEGNGRTGKDVRKRRKEGQLNH